MRQNFRSHGKHCFKRSFPTECRKCGKEVLYWECFHGSKLFFEYPPYGKLVRHYCRKVMGKNLRNKYPVIVKSQEKLIEKASPSCPSCGKLFKNENALKEHQKQLKNRDELHGQLIKIDSEVKTENNSSNYVKPKFGKINIKPKNQE